METTVALEPELIHTDPPLCIVWSGGYDSTALILKNQGARFRTVSFSLENNPLQSESEKRARSTIRQILTKEDAWKGWTDHIEYTIPSLPSNNGFSLIQAYLWHSLAPLFSGESTVIEFGYVRGDDVWHYKSMLEGIRENVKRMDKKVEWSYPFEWMKKEDLLACYKGREWLLPLISTSEYGDHWTVDNTDKGKEMRSLWEMARLKSSVPETEKAVELR